MAFDIFLWLLMRVTRSTENKTCWVHFPVLLLLCSPAISLGFTILGEIFVYLTIFNPTIEVVTFRLRGWCMLGVFFVASIHRPWTWMSGSFESVWWNACVHRLDLSLYSHPKEFGENGIRTHVNSKGKIPSTVKILPRGGSTPRLCIQQDTYQRATLTPFPVQFRLIRMKFYFILK